MFRIPCPHRSLAGLAALLFLVGCQTSVSRVSSDEVIDLSGGWNDSDSQIVSREMIIDALSHHWLDEFAGRGLGRRPVLIVGEIRNHSSEHINTRTFVRDLERAVINSGKADFIADAGQREQIRRERDSQVGTTRESMRSEHGDEMGADYMLIGSFDSIVDQEGKRKVVFYQVNLELVDLRSNRKVWIGDKKIKKYVSKAGLRR